MRSVLFMTNSLIYGGLGLLSLAVAVILRRGARGSEIYGKMGVKVAGLGGQNEHQVDPGSHEICM